MWPILKIRFMSNNKSSICRIRTHWTFRCEQHQYRTNLFQMGIEPTSRTLINIISNTKNASPICKITVYEFICQYSLILYKTLLDSQQPNCILLKHKHLHLLLCYQVSLPLVFLLSLLGSFSLSPLFSPSAVGTAHFS